MKKVKYFCFALIGSLLAIPAAPQNNDPNQGGVEGAAARADVVQPENKKPDKHHKGKHKGEKKGKHKAKSHHH